MLTFATELINIDYGCKKDQRTNYQLAESSTRKTASMARRGKDALGREETFQHCCGSMKEFNIDRINAKAPYEVSIDGKQFVFETQYSSVGLSNQRNLIGLLSALQVLLSRGKAFMLQSLWKTETLS